MSSCQEADSKSQNLKSPKALLTGPAQKTLQTKALGMSVKRKQL